MHRLTHTGPAASNPRNRKRPGLRHGNIDGLDDQFADALKTKQWSKVPGLTSITTDDGDELIGTVGISDLTWQPARQEVTFQFWEYPNPGSTVWRVLYDVTVHLDTGIVDIGTTDVAPDIDDGSQPPSFNDGSGPESLPA